MAPSTEDWEAGACRGQGPLLIGEVPVHIWLQGAMDSPLFGMCLWGSWGPLWYPAHVASIGRE